MLHRKGRFGSIAREAWEHSPVGESELEGHRIVKDNKFVLVMHRDPYTDRTEYGYYEYPIVAFPTVPNMGKLRRVFESLRGFHVNIKQLGQIPNDPEAAGTLMLYLDNPDVTEGRWIDASRNLRSLGVDFNGKLHEISYVQSHYEVGTQEGRVERSFATKHHGWRLRALKEAIRLARNTNSVLFLRKVHANKHLFESRFGGKSQFHRDIEEALNQGGGGKVIKKDDYYFIIPSHPE